MAQRVQKQSPKEPTGFVLEGDVLMAQKKTAQALKAYEAAYAVRKSAALVVKLHSVYMQAGRHDEAKARVADWLTEFPEDNGVRLYMAGDKLKRGDLKSAIEDYEMLLKKLPDNVIVLNNLAWAYHRVNDARALETAERAYKLGPDSAPVADTLGWILVQHASSARGLELLQKAASAAPNSPGIRYHLAYASYKAGDTTRARTELERLFAMKVDFDQQAEARKLLEQLRR
jgi:putative PEP-CTERM system TPR-repeat lipoprotein